MQCVSLLWLCSLCFLINSPTTTTPQNDYVGPIPNIPVQQYEDTGEITICSRNYPKTKDARQDYKTADIIICNPDQIDY